MGEQLRPAARQPRCPAGTGPVRASVGIEGHQVGRGPPGDIGGGRCLESHLALRAANLEDPVEAGAARREVVTLGYDEDAYAGGTARRDQSAERVGLGVDVV